MLIMFITYFILRINGIKLQQTIWQSIWSPAVLVNSSKQVKHSIHPVRKALNRGDKSDKSSQYETLFPLSIYHIMYFHIVLVAVVFFVVVVVVCLFVLIVFIIFFPSSSLFSPLFLSPGYLLEFTKKPSQTARSCNVIKVTDIGQPLLFSLCLKEASSGEEQQFSLHGNSFFCLS